MAIDARNTPHARMKRWGGLAAGGLAALVALTMTISAYVEAFGVSGSIRDVEKRVQEHILAADAAARQCGIPPFSDLESLKTFPMEVPEFPTKREKECLRDVGNARADLQDDHIELDDLRVREEDAYGSATTRLIMAVVLLAGWLGAFWYLEILPRRAASGGR